VIVGLALRAAPRFRYRAGRPRRDAPTVIYGPKDDDGRKEDKVGEEQEQKNGNASGQSRMNAPASERGNRWAANEEQTAQEGVSPD